MSPRKGFDADRGAFTLCCFAVLCRGVVCWTLGRVGAGQWGLELENGGLVLSGVGPFPGMGFQTPVVDNCPSSARPQLWHSRSRRS